MTEPAWEDVTPPAGSFVSWGNQIGQHVTGRVIEYNPAGGTDFAQNVCPQLTVELTESAASITKDGSRTDFGAGELVTLNCGQVSLKRAIKAADPAVGDLVKITLANLVKTANGTVKEFQLRIARTGQAKPQPQPQQFQAAPAAAAPFQQAPAQALPPF